MTRTHVDKSVLMTLEHLRSLQTRADISRGARVSAIALELCKALVEGRRAAEERLDRERADRVGELGESEGAFAHQDSHSLHDLSAIDEGEAKIDVFLLFEDKTTEDERAAVKTGDWAC